MNTVLVTYPGPQGEPASPDYVVTANGQPVFCYGSYRFDPESPDRTIGGLGMKDRPATRIALAYFDFEGEVNLEITVIQPFQGVVVRPLSLGIEPEAEDNVIRFTIAKPGTYIVEPYGTRRPLHIFANPPEKDIPDPNDPNVRYFPPGIHHIDPLELCDGETVYVAGGAIVYANVVHDGLSEWDDMVFQRATIGANGAKGIRVTGRGILCGRDSLEKGRRHKLIEMTKCEDIAIDGVILRESSGWSLAVYDSERVRIDRVRIVGHYINNDGIDICSSRDVRVTRCFCHNADDSFLIKAHDASVTDVEFRDCIVWNDVATSFGIVCEIAHPVENVRFRDCVVVHSTHPCWIPEAGGVLAVWNDFGGDVRDVLFDNIIIEDACAGKAAIKLNVTNVFGENEQRRGTIRQVTFRDVAFLRTNDDAIVISSPFEDRAIENVSFERVTINGESVISEGDSRLFLEGVGELRFKN